MDDPRTTGSSGLPGELVDLLEDFTGYLRRERSLASTTVENYLNRSALRRLVRPTPPDPAGRFDNSRCERVPGMAVGHVRGRIAESRGDGVAGVAAVDVP
jgi:hypothetical protein